MIPPMPCTQQLHNLVGPNQHVTVGSGPGSPLGRTCFTILWSPVLPSDMRPTHVYSWSVCLGGQTGLTFLVGSFKSTETNCGRICKL